MRRRHRQVIVEVSPTRHELAVFEQGRLIGHRASRPAEPAGGEDWSQTVQSLGTELGAWVPELGVTGEAVTVVYTGPDTAASIYGCPASAGEQRARLAARLAMADTISFPLEQNAHAEFCLHRDRAAAGGESPKLRTLALADTEATLLALSVALEGCGLRAERFVPAPGASLAAAVGSLLRQSTPGAPHVVTWVGEHSSVIAGGEGDRIAFARLIPVGTETLVEALASPLASGRADQGIALDQFSAREMLFASGVPTADGWNDATTTADARAVLPLLQPVLQRMVVEIKQSIRFGFPAEVRAQATLSLHGPGSHIAGLGATIAEGAGVNLVDARPDDGSDAAAIRGDLAAALELGGRVPALETREAATGRVLSSAYRAVVVGAALALAAIGSHAFESWNRLNRARTTLEELSGRSDRTAPAVLAVRGALAARAGVSRAEASRHLALGSATPHAEFLKTLAALTPEGVELTEINLSDDDTGSACGLRGVVTGDDTLSDSDRFSRYAAVLAGCPLVLDTSLGETRRGVENGRRTLDFSMTLELVKLPTVPGAPPSDPEGGPTR